MSGNRTYSEDEVQRILSKSLRLQEDSNTRGGLPSSGLDVAEIREIAKEVGIAPEFLEEALSSTTTSYVVKEDPGFLWSPKLLEISGTINNELSEEAIMAIARETRKTLDKRGVLETVGSSFDWAASDKDDNSTTLEGDSSQGSSELRLKYKPRTVKSLIYSLPLVFAAGPAFGIISENQGNPLWAFLILFIVLGISHVGFRTFYSGKRRELIDLFQNLESIAASKPPSKSVEIDTSEAKPAVQSRIDLRQAEGYETSRESEGSRASARKRKIP